MYFYTRQTQKKIFSKCNKPGIWLVVSNLRLAKVISVPEVSLLLSCLPHYPAIISNISSKATQ